MLLLFHRQTVNYAGGEEVYRYKGVFSPNPFHNATYLAARGFSVISFFSFLELLDGLHLMDSSAIESNQLLNYFYRLLGGGSKERFMILIMVAMILVFVVKNVFLFVQNGAELVIPVGKSVGIVGTSGAGKSTVVDILLGLLEPKNGQILADGQNIKEDGNYRP